MTNIYEQRRAARDVRAPLIAAAPGGGRTLSPLAVADLSCSDRPLGEETFDERLKIETSWRGQTVRLLLVGDLTAISVGVVVGYLIRFGLSPVSIGSISYPCAAATLIVGWMASLALFRTFDPRLFGVGTEEFRRTVLASLALFGAVAITSYVFKLTVPRGFVAAALPLGLALLLIERMLVRGWLQRQRLRGRLAHRVIVVGADDGVRALAEQIRREPFAGFMLVGACTPTGLPPLDGGLPPVVGRTQDVLGVVHRFAADTVAVTASHEITPADIRKIAWSLEGSGVDLIVAPSVTDVAGPRITIRPVGGLPMLYVDEPSFNGAKRVLKRVLDVLLSLLGLALLGIPLLLIALTIRLTSSGPALFRQVRIGRDGLAFRVFKFRTMCVNAEECLSRPTRRQRDQRTALQDPQRSPDHSDRSVPAPYIHRRAAPTAQRPRRRHVPGRPSATASPERGLRRRCAPPAPRAPRDHRPLAGIWPVGHLVGGRRPVRSLLRGELVADPGPHDPVADWAGRMARRGCVLILSQLSRRRRASPVSLG